MVKSLFSGVSGLKTHQQKMDVIGNNIANVNTTGYKTNTVTFQDIYYQTRKSGSAGSSTQGGVNPTQVGYGAQLGTIDQVMGQSGFTYSDKVFDCALSGEGFFQVMDSAGNIFYTRAGSFKVDSAGNFTDSNGNMVLGVNGNSNGVEASSNRLTFSVPEVLDNRANYSKKINGYDLTISAAEAGPEGNISVGFIAGSSDYAYISGSKLMIQLNENNLYTNTADVEDAIARACVNGGVSMDAVLPLDFEFESTPAAADILAATGKNTLNVTDGTTACALEFETTVTGEYANNYTVSLRYAKNASETTAKWTDNGLVITVIDGATVQDIQDAIYKAAGATVDTTTTPHTYTGGTAKKILTVTSTDWDTNVAAADLETMLGDGTAAKIGLTGGKNNFFSDVIDVLGNVKLTDGRVQAEQTVKDLIGYEIHEDGCIYGVHSVHGTIQLGRIDIATFDNPNGLEKVGTSYWRATMASGEAQVNVAGEGGAAEVVSSALEMSNVDLSQEFSDMIITQRGFQANSRIITTSDSMLEEIVNLKR